MITTTLLPTPRLGNDLPVQVIEMPIKSVTEDSRILDLASTLDTNTSLNANQMTDIRDGVKYIHRQLHSLRHITMGFTYIAMHPEIGLISCGNDKPTIIEEVRNQFLPEYHGQRSVVIGTFDEFGQAYKKYVEAKA